MVKVVVVMELQVQLLVIMHKNIQVVVVVEVVMMVTVPRLMVLKLEKVVPVLFLLSL